MHKAPRWTEDDLKRIKGKVRGGVGGDQINGDSHSGGRPRHGRAIVNSRKSVTNPAPSPYKSKLEAAFANHLALLQKAGEIDGWLYEPFPSMRLCEGKRYRVDFVSWKYQSLNGAEFKYDTVAYECKGWHKNYRDSLTHLKWAAQRFPFFSWKKVVSNGKRGFEIMDVQV